jgi:L-amino acid N-acyltransferase YncA
LLLQHLIAVLEADGFWTLQAQIIADNRASRALHKKHGFREVGYRERYGHIGGRWHDVVLLERRSQTAGGTGLPTKSC